MVPAIVLYAQALEAFHQQNYLEAHRLLGKLHVMQPEFPRAWLLEAYLYRAEAMPLSELSILKHFLAMYRLPCPEPAVFAEAWSLLGAVQSSLGFPVQARQSFWQSVHLEPDAGKRLNECSNALFASNHTMQGQGEWMQARYKDYRGLLTDLHIQPYPPRIYHHRKLRIAYLSADLHYHPVASFIYTLFHGFNREAFDVYAYASSAAVDDVTRDLQAQVTNWRDVSQMDFKEIATVIRSDEIDILFDLSGHTADNCLPVLAWRPALVQISGIGYFNSTGLPEVDYFLSDRYCAGTEAQSRFVEKLLVMPQTHFCYHPLRPMPPCAPAPSTDKGYITFGCFNNFAKVTDAMLQIWKCILQRIPQARLLLKHSLFDSCEGREAAQRRLQANGLPLQRIELRGFTADYLKEYYMVDIALDTYPYTGGITTCEALYMGVPVVSLYGDTHGSRFGYSLLGNLGLKELAASTVEEYADRAAALAQDKTLLAALHRRLRSMMVRSPLMDGTQYVRNMEKFYQQIYQRGAT